MTSALAPNLLALFYALLNLLKFHNLGFVDACSAIQVVERGEIFIQDLLRELL